MNQNPGILHATLSRRELLAGAVASGIAGAGIGFARAAEPPPALVIDTRILEVKGRAAEVLGFTGPNGRPGLDFVLGQRFEASLTNALSEDTLIHWHGLAPPIAMDGVPMLSGPTIKPGETRHYAFDNNRAGTHWMHSHVGLQEQSLLAAPLIIRETATPLFDEQEHVVMLHDFTFRDPQEILSELQAGGGEHAMHVMPTDHSAHGGGAVSVAPENMKNIAALSDISYDAMLANDHTLDDPEIVKVEKGGRLRLRIINGCAASNMWIDLGALSAELIAVDGNTIHAVRGSRFPLAIAQRADIRIVLPSTSGAWPVMFRAEGSELRSGIVVKAGEANVAKISDKGDVAPALDLALEKQLRSVAQIPDNPVSRTEFVMLTGGGADYLWGLNGKASIHDVLFNVREGERYEIVLHNMTGMAHPMHLHGHYFKVVAIGSQRIDGALRDTVLVPIGESVAIQFDADNPGTWAFHCHHIYHMNSGMMGAIAYAGAA